jgi:hypothetical protein
MLSARASSRAGGGGTSSKVWDAEDDADYATSHGEQAPREMSTPDGSEGMLAVWALLNISTHHEGKVVVCRKGLYTLLTLVQQSSGQRSIAAGPDMQRL